MKGKSMPKGMPPKGMPPKDMAKGGMMDKGGHMMPEKHEAMHGKGGKKGK